MDALYSDLENYQDENIIAELRNENRELKSKLEEYASTLTSLQKDFDKLSAEYKRLEINYSSLLKTARAEIERKSQLIINLNLEKDKLVIESLQNRGKAFRRNINYNGDKQHRGLPSSGEGDSAKQKESVDSNSTVRNVVESSQINNERKVKQDKNPSLDPGPKGDTKEKEQNPKTSDHNKQNDKNDNKKRKPDQDVSTNEAVNKVSKIRNRRKSMPLLNRGDYKFSSDEDQNDEPRDYHFRRKTPVRDEDQKDDPRDYRFRRRTPIRDVVDRKHETYYNGRTHSERKVPEMARARDRQESKYDSSRDIHRKSNNWLRDNDRHRIRDNRDKYESTQRHRHYSPERPYHNTQDLYYNKHRETHEKPYWSDNVRYRVLESPPPEKYNQRQRSRDSDRSRFDKIQHEDINPIKHKICDVSEEPPSKRPRSESLNKKSDTYHVNFQQERDVGNHATSTCKPLHLSYLSLQSPDHVHHENNPPTHHIKEIMGTAVTKLDDPRLTSKKYVVRTHNDKIMLTTVGKDLDIKVIDTSTWDIDKNKELYKMPTPLRETPQIDKDFVQDIYVGIDDPISNLSLESGEICLDEEDDMALVCEKGKVTVESTVNKKVYDNNLHSQIKDPILNERQTIKVDNMQQASSNVICKNYKIPKVSKTSTSKPVENYSSQTSHKPDKKRIDKPSHKNKSNREKRNLDKKLQPELQHYNPLKMFSDAIGVCKNKSNKFIDVGHQKHFPESVISPRDTVEGDLELSDETCDYTEALDEIRLNKETNVKSEIPDKNRAFDSINNELKNSELENPDNKNSCVFKHKLKAAECESNHLDIPFKDCEKESKEYKEKVKSRKEDKTKDIKSKLCDLFGDTSSLITPEDLGIAPSSSTKENLNEYAPLFDNTQDAVDLNIEEMEKTKTRFLKVKRNQTPKNDFQEDVTLEKRVLEKDADKKPKKDNKQTSRNSIEKTSPIQQMFENINTETEPQDDRTVKTVIISTGIQNTARTENPSYEKQEKQATNIKNENAPNFPLLNLTALATSTPHKEIHLEPSSSVNEISCHSNKSGVTKDTTNITSCDTQSNSDVPDLRIIVKRRRKPRGKTS